MQNFDAKCVAKGGVPLGEPIPVEKEKRGKIGSQSATDTVFDSPVY